MDVGVTPRNEKAKVSNQNIPYDLAFSIMSKLPLKSLKPFGCCCKSWRLLFENPRFMSIYRNNFIFNYCCSYDYNETSVLLQHLEPFVSDDSYSVSYWISGERFENKVKLDRPPPF